MTLLNLPQNSVLLDLLREQGEPPRPTGLAYEGWELHTHPDLVERLEELAGDWPVLPTFGVPVLAAKGIAAVLALGTNSLLVRLPEAPPEALAPAAPRPPLTDPGQDWYAVSAWQSELHSTESARLLSEVVRHALSYAAGLSSDTTTDWRGRPVQTPPTAGGKAGAKRKKGKAEQRRPRHS
ncbi:hypothetical protein CFP65_1157 [Kitasatospora sp. MMS16-BH015]|uniref:hypothetical protein n=1 Tax=Kitasatospora sp. MMS16-BH015 TaxID=2018025 RepID=UPI000CA30021|nr:hypothetical protein [Kitasatospora sp. MMS16-BH015]AUG76067.1 hypothetical protein CFP65_1157 [Kitasatospora sp. MMS16-BH015]